MAPEVISGESKQSKSSDMFAVGGVIYKILDNNKLTTMPDYNSKLSKIAEQCRSVRYNQ